MSVDVDITPHTKVGDLLDDAALERVLLEAAPAFRKLKNPVLRRTLARVASLRQAAEIGGVEVSALVAALRQAAGQAPATDAAPDAATEPTASGQAAGTEPPSWVVQGQVRVLIDADLALDRGDNPLGLVSRALPGLAPGELVQVTAAFKPVPLIDTLASAEVQLYTQELGDGRWRTWIGLRRDGRPRGGER